MNSPIENAVGITTTVPSEILLAAGKRPVDLNNIFITSEHAQAWMNRAEQEGFPKSYCAWIKGLYGAVLSSGISELVGVMEGDCSSTKVLLEVLNAKGIQSVPFAYPYNETPEALMRELESLMEHYGVTPEQAENQRQRLAPLRDLAMEIDRLTWEEMKATGFENHLHLVSCSDYNGDPDAFEAELRKTAEMIRKRPSQHHLLKLGYTGVPPMMGDLYDYVETRGARIVYNEVQREFSFPRHRSHNTLCGQYLDFTYPCSTQRRMAEIREQIRIRGLKGILHYSQAFCHRAAEEILLSEGLGVPVLSISADRETALDSRTKLRLEAFIDMLQDQTGGLTP